MENGYGSIDFMKFPGAYIASDGNGNNVVVIPVRHSDIKVSADMKHASVGLGVIETRSEYREACMKNNADKPNYTPPTYHVELSFSKEKYESLCESVAKKVVTEHPEWGMYSHKEKGNPLYNEVYRRVHIRLGTITKFSSEFTGTAPKAQLSSVMPEQVDDDLPF